MEASLSAEWSPATVDLDGPRMGREPDDESPCSLLIVAKMAQLRIPGLRALDQTHLLAIKLDVADQNRRQDMHTSGLGDRSPRLKRKNPPTIDDRGDVLIVAPKSARDHHGETKTKLMLCCVFCV
jgi:hypothetical protein